MKLFVLSYVNWETALDGEPIFLGVFSSRDNIEAALRQLREQPGFRDHPGWFAEGQARGFKVDEVTVDDVAWKDGFGT
jgi:hypothetical protein